MNHNHTNVRNISPFLEGVARNFDFANTIDDSIPVSAGGEDPIVNDWRAIGSDYQNSVKIISEELNGSKKNHKKK